ncbi:Synaptotagmin-2 [Mactra antiquata]
MATTEAPPEAGIGVIYLTFWNKVAITSGAVGFLLLVSICMVCILCPECLCHAICCPQDNEEKKKRKYTSGKFGSSKSDSSKGIYGSTGSDFLYGTPMDEFEKLSKPRKSHDVTKDREAGTSDWSSDTGSAHEVIKLEKLKKNGNIVENGFHDNMKCNGTVGPIQGGQIDFSLSYSMSDEKLNVRIIEVKNIELESEASLMTPYVKVRLYRTPKQFFTFRDPAEKSHVIVNLEKEFKTKMQRSNKILSYKEDFEMDVDLESLKSFTIRLLLCDMDKYSRHVILGETSVNLKKTKLWTVRELMFSEKLQEPIEEKLGNIVLGLCYLPTSEKMYLSVEKIENLRVVDKITESTDPCVKVYLMYEGKQLKRVKTSVRASDLNPVYNESFSFDVPLTEVDKVCFSLAVCHYNADKKSTKLIGRVYLGMNFDKFTRDHWTSMMNNPRKKIVATYKISN